jgi:hypothetical protein
MIELQQSSQIPINGSGPNTDQFNQLMHLQGQLRSAEAEIFRLREQQRSELDVVKQDAERSNRQFKADVLAIFDALGARIPGMKATADNIEEYVREMKELVVSANLDESERDRVLQKVMAEANTT